MDMEEEKEDSGQQINNRPWLFKKGQSGNPSGRRKGSISMKEFAKKYLETLPDDKKIEFLEGLPKDIIWKMAEGNPHSSTDAKVEVKIPKPLTDVLDYDSNTKD